MNKTFLISVAFATALFFACGNNEAPNETDSSSSGISSSSSSSNSSNSSISSSGENSNYSSSSVNSQQSGNSSSSGDSSQSDNSSSGGSSSQSGNSSSGMASSSSIAGLSSSLALISSSSSQLPSAGSWPKLQEGQSGVQKGWASRYWDGCKAHCSHRENVDTTAVPFSICKNCNSNNEEIPAFAISPDANQWWTGYKGTPSSCEQGGVAFTCFDMAPLKIADTLSYAFAAAPGNNAACGSCFQLQFDGGNHGNDVKESHKLIKGKTLIILASNIGHDVEGGQFDILIPGGGVGAYDSFTNLLGVSKDDMGATFGGFLTACQQSLNDYNLPAARYKECVAQKCNAVFGKSPKFADLLRGCLWFTEWYEAADNPTFLYKKVDCPKYLTDKYRSSINTEPNTNIEWRAW